MRTVRFETENPYDEFIGKGAIQKLPNLVANALRVAVVYSEAVSGIADEIVEMLAGHQITRLKVPNGEKAKTIETLSTAWEQLAEAGFTRTDMIVAVGGGATTDLGGFLAATWLRGVKYVNVPTTVLAMTDAAVGGKTGINIAAGKNLVGAFHEPKGVIADTNFLRTLPQEEIVSGLGEITKCGFIKDTEILRIVQENPQESLDRKSEIFIDLIRRGAQVKAETVASDLYESTDKRFAPGREALNYGHTLAHAIEATEDFTWRHGEADAIGMTFAAELALRLRLITQEVVDLHRKVFSAVGLPTTYSGVDWKILREKMNLDKKTRGNTLRFILLDEIPGQVQVVEGPNEADLEAAFAAIGG